MDASGLLWPPAVLGAIPCTRPVHVVHLPPFGCSRSEPFLVEFPRCSLAEGLVRPDGVVDGLLGPEPRASAHLDGPDREGHPLQDSVQEAGRRLPCGPTMHV